ncbi:aspartate carbamoyltransferase catalytic subunit [Thermocrinis minervae]|uniref:Aspartate carbamoyltransferase n=1 Tax=Thermocrinis minervae TaxID=381751 RepID=A0A1M6QUS7_9AQUI|nr:aspartate carbamoyltransferase catalytic subunit [Thermocrinis minervae]SHK23848.1 aspartate carbamoyltransferase [Thermocrinis minervae]
MKHLISVKDLTKEDVESFYKLFLDFKKGRREFLEGHVALLFLEASTRTRFSFELACRELGLNTYYAGRGETSIEKGESFYHTLKVLESMGYRAVIFRVPFVLFPYDPYLSLSISLINAGDGTHQHPTQGLVDLFTLLEVFGKVEGLNILYVGDVKHSRVFRSGAYLFNMFGARVAVCGPSVLIPEDLSPFEAQYIPDVDEGIEWAHVVIWLRLQEERFLQSYVPSKESYFLQYGLTKERYKKLKSFFMHPGPANLGVDVDPELIHAEKSLYLKQASNGPFVRMAVLYKLLSS